MHFFPRSRGGLCNSGQQLPLPSLQVYPPQSLPGHPGPSVGSSTASSRPCLIATHTSLPCPRLCTSRIPAWDTHSSLFYGLFHVPMGPPSYPSHPGAPTPFVGALHMPWSWTAKCEGHPRLCLLEARLHRLTPSAPQDWAQGVETLARSIGICEPFPTQAV